MRMTGVSPIICTGQYIISSWTQNFLEK